MCGFIGGVFLDPNTELDMPSALQALRHRGPDDASWFKEADYAFGHTRLAIIDKRSLANQPMVSPEGNVLVFNGEIYNHNQLRDELFALGYKFQTRSDTEVILHGYGAWGDSLVTRLDGMFAIAIYNRRSSELLLARDRAGKKPLFYATLGTQIIFASEPKAIFASGAVTPTLCPQALPFILTFGYVPSPNTNYHNLKQVPPATWVKFDAQGNWVNKRYWKVPFGEAKPTSPDIRKLVEQAVASRMEADVPMGAFLSGGIDSSIVVGVMSKLKKEPVKTFSLGFADAPNYDETAYARLASAAFKTQHTEIKLGSNCWQHVEKLVTLYDGPVGDYSALPTYIVSGLAREQVSVALTGDGGDEIFCGYPRFIAGEWSESIPSSLLKIGLLLGGSPGPGKRTFIAQMRRFLSVASLPLAERMAAWSSYQTPQGEPLAWVKGMFESTEGLHPLARILSHNFESYLPEDLLVKADRCSMAHGLELRSPFLDTKLIEGATQLAPRALRRGRDTKIALKKAFEDILPAQILRRGKMGFGMPLGLWFRTDWASSLVELIGARQAKIYDYMDFNFGQKLLTSHLKGAQDNASLLWILMTLELWLLRK